MKNKYLTISCLAIILCISLPILQNLNAQDGSKSTSFEISFNKSQSSKQFEGQIIKTSELLPSPFCMLSGFVMEQDLQCTIQYRTFQNATWSEWEVLKRNNDLSDRTSFGPIDLDSSIKYVQMRSSEQIQKSLQLRLYFPGFSTVNSGINNISKRVSCECPQPDFCGRDCWSDGSHPIDSTPEPTKATHIIVHHSAGQTNSPDFAAVVRSYWDFHVNTNGWDDIGYNWLIDPNGIIYEGRGEGLQGAHFSCMNRNTTGICMIGNYEIDNPSPLSIESLENFISWEACSKNIPVLNSDYHENSDLFLANIAGHLDGNISDNACSSTLCPGINLYPLLEEIRQEVSERDCYEYIPTSRENILAENRIHVAPNPTSGAFSIYFENSVIKGIELFQADGQAIYQESIEEGRVKVVALNVVSDLSPGIYLLKLQLDNGQSVVEKISVIK